MTSVCLWLCDSKDPRTLACCSCCWLLPLHSWSLYLCCHFIVLLQYELANLARVRRRKGPAFLLSWLPSMVRQRLCLGVILVTDPFQGAGHLCARIFWCGCFLSRPQVTFKCPPGLGLS